MRKITTGCCALCQIDKVTNGTSKQHLKYMLEKLKREKDANTEVGVTTGNGQTSVFIIVSPGENKLEENLKSLNFQHIHNFERRKGYPETGDLKMYIKNL